MLLPGIVAEGAAQLSDATLQCAGFDNRLTPDGFHQRLMGYHLALVLGEENEHLQNSGLEGENRLTIVNLSTLQVDPEMLNVKFLHGTEIRARGPA